MQPKLFVSVLALTILLPLSLFGQISFDPEEIDITLEPDLIIERNLTVTNEGESDVEFWITRNLVPGEEEDYTIEPWTLLFAENAQESIGDDRLRGVAYGDGFFYFAGGNSGDDDNYIYVLNEDGELEDAFLQPDNESVNGVTDMAWGMGLLWAVSANDGRTVYGFSPVDGEVFYEFNAGRTVTSLAWDTERNLLWATNVNADLFGYDPEGDMIRNVQIDNIRSRGIGFYPEDADGFQVYSFVDNPDISRRQVVKINVDANHEDYRDIMEVTELDFDEEGDVLSAKALEITNEYDPHHWFFMALLDNDDWFVIWELAGYMGWIDVYPMAGSIAAGESMDFTLTIDTWNLPDDEFAGELLFNMEDADGYPFYVTVDISFERVATSRELDFHAGWNHISLNIQPDEPEIATMFGGLAEDGNLILLKDSYGNFYSPMYEYEGVPDWDVQEGYLVEMNYPATMEWAGESRLSSDTLNLEMGWQYVSFYPRRPVEAEIALSPIVDVLTIAKDGWGRFYVPEYGFSNMGMMSEGNAYSVYVTEDVDLIYALERPVDIEGVSFAGSYNSVYDTPGQLPVHAVTPSNMRMLVNASPGSNAEVGVYVGDMLVGSGALENGKAGIAVWGDDPTTPELDGALEGDALTIKLLVDGNLTDAEFNATIGEAIYKTDAFTVINIEDSVQPSEFGLVSAYPNPFNSATRINFNLEEAAEINIAVFDLTGRQVAQVAQGRASAGNHTATLNGIDLASGVYIVNLTAGSTTSQMKITLIK